MDWGRPRTITIEQIAPEKKAGRGSKTKKRYNKVEVDLEDNHYAIKVKGDEQWYYVTAQMIEEVKDEAG